jgi:SNF2 family DNA or RNA helicase
MNDKHPITPPPELVQQWHDECHKVHEPFLVHVANQAARWGADQELEACATYIARNWKLSLLSDELICARRPKPPSLKEQALALVSHDFSNQPCLSEEGYALIRRAIEALPE